jgi:hypothetical protein
MFKINTVHQGGIMNTIIETNSRPNIILSKPRTMGFSHKKVAPRTIMGAKLWKLRKKIVASGTPLLDWDAIEQEVIERKGE